MEEKSVRSRVAELAASSDARMRYLALFTSVALLVAAGAALLVRQHGVAMVHEVTVLDCPYTGNGAHVHTTDCYDEGTNLVCPLEQREPHVHDDSCYEEEYVLVCDLEEFEAHQHTDACYDEEGNLICEFDEYGIHTHDSDCYDEHGDLICTLPEGEPHQHSDECYEVERTLVCGQEETDEEHVHGPGCFRTILVNQDGEEVSEEELAQELAEEEAELVEDEQELQADIEDEGDQEDADVSEDATDEGATDEGEAEEGVDPDAQAEQEAVDDAEGDAQDQDEPEVEDAQDKTDAGDDAADKGADDKKADYAKDVADKQADDAKNAADKKADEADAADKKDDEATSMPAQVLEGDLLDDDGKVLVHVTARAPKGAFHAGTTMKVKPVDEATVKSAIDSVSSSREGSRVASVQAVDISFYDKYGVEIEPAKPVTVKITSDGINQGTESMVVHIDSNGNGNVVETIESEEAEDEATTRGELAFDANAF